MPYIYDHILQNWLAVLEWMYLVFAVRPYTRNLARTVVKPMNCEQ